MNQNDRPLRSVSCLQIVIAGMLVVILLYAAAAGVAFPFLNPKANNSVFYTHLYQTLRFQRIPEFQEANKGD